MRVRPEPRRQRHTAKKVHVEIRAALEAVGIGFQIEIEDGQFKPVGVTYSPRKPNGE